MIRAKMVVLASLLVVAAACAGPSAEAVRGPSSAAPAGAAPTGATPAVAAPTGATPAVAAPAVAVPAPARVEESRVVCEYVRRSGSNIATRECREVNHFVDDPSR